MSDLYQEIILEEAKNPQNYGTLDDADVVLHERNSSCGDEVTVYIKFDETQQRISQLKWQGHGCIISQAAMSVLAGKMSQEHLSMTEIQALSKNEMEALLGIEDISPGRLKCLLLGVQAIKNARKDK